MFLQIRFREYYEKADFRSGATGHGTSEITAAKSRPEGRLFNSTLIVDQAAINAGFDFRR
jgi:hypothetical protein